MTKTSSSNNSANVKGFVFYKNSKGTYFYINYNREHIQLCNDFHIVVNKDKIYKNIIRRTAKEYTYIGYERICGKFFLNNDAIKTTWISKEEFNKDFLFID